MGSTAAIERGLRVGELAEAVGATSDTIRYYERAGLLPPPRRTPAGYRAYDVLAVDRLRFIQGAQRLGLRLADIRDLLSVRDTGSCACGPAEDLLAQRLAEVDAEIARLSALRHEMPHHARRADRRRLSTSRTRYLVPTERGGGETHGSGRHRQLLRRLPARGLQLRLLLTNLRARPAPWSAPGRIDYAIPAPRSGAVGGG